LNQTQEVLYHLNAIESDVRDLQAFARQYLRTGDEEYGKAFRHSRDAARKALTNLERFLADDPSQRRKLEELTALVESGEKLSFEPILHRRQKADGSEVSPLTDVQEQVHQAIREVHKLASRMERRENEVLKQRQAATQASLRNLQVILVSGNLFAVG